MSTWVGQTLGKVRIDALLARGGMAEVYIGTHTGLQREVAVKILRNNYDERPHTLERFQREAMVVGKLRHPNIVQVFDFDTTVDGEPYLVMEYIKGPSLQAYLNALHTINQRLEFPHVVRLMNAMTSALQYAHDSGVIHRDIKPGNILLTSRSSQVTTAKPLPEDFEPVLTDFGLVRFIDSTHHTTGSGQIAGTPAYMSPEQARGEFTDGRTDIYSLGIVLYEILAGHLPFDGETTMGVLMKHINAPPEPIPGLPPGMQLVLDQALAKDVNDRLQSPAEFGDAFSKAVEDRSDYSTLEVLSAAPVKKPARKIFNSAKQRRWIAPALAAVVVVAVGASILLNGRPSLTPETSTPASTATLPAPSNTPTRTQTPPPLIVLGRTGILQFQNGSSLADQASLTAEALLAPPEGSRYEVWLTNEDERISLGFLAIDETGKGTLTFTHEKGLNLISLYDGVEVTIEPNPDSDPKTSGVVAYSFTLPAEGLTHIRYLLSSFPNTPDENGLIEGLYANIKTIDELAREMQKESDNGNQDRALVNAEAIQNIIVGDQSPSHKDLNNDGQVDDPGDGFGLLLNGRNLGYLPAVYTEADSTVNSPGASQQMLTYGEDLKTSVQNLAQWTPQLQDLIAAILNSTAGADVKQQIADAAALADKMLNGTDLDGDGRIDPEPGESGAQVAYEAAYRMADMPLKPVGILNLGTGTPTFILVAPTVTPGGGGSGGSTVATQVATQHEPPGQVRTPPGQEKTRRPPNDSNNTTTDDTNNGNGNGNNP